MLTILGTLILILIILIIISSSALCWLMRGTPPRLLLPGLLLTVRIVPLPLTIPLLLHIGACELKLCCLELSLLMRTLTSVLYCALLSSRDLLLA